MSPKKLDFNQKRGVAVLAAGAYVLSSIKDELLDEIADMNFAPVSWESQPRMISIESKRRGAQARFGWVSTDGRWLRYPSFPVSYGAVDSFKARVEEPSETIRRLLSSTPVKVIKPLAKTTLKVGMGYLLEDRAAMHNTLICVNNGILHLIPFELKPPAHGADELGSVHNLTETEATAVRSELTDLANRGTFSMEKRDLRSVSLPFTWRS